MPVKTRGNQNCPYINLTENVQNKKEVVVNNKNIPSYNNLFGNVDFRDGDVARSVYSPAAYLTDLLQVIDDEFLSLTTDDERYKYELNQRRDDIKSILLNNGNTFDVLPYLDIVNERLENKIYDDSKQNAYDYLRSSAYPVGLLFDLENEKFKLYLKYLSTAPEEFYKTFTSGRYDGQTVALESLGLSLDEAKIVTTSVLGAELDVRIGNKLDDMTVTDVEGNKAFVTQKLTDSLSLSYLQLSEILTQNLSKNEVLNHRAANFYVNAKLGGYACFDQDELTVIWRNADTGLVDSIPDEWLDRVFRTRILSQKQNISIPELDLILRHCCNSKLNAESLKRIAVIVHLKRSFDLSNATTCALFSPLTSLAQGDGEQPLDMFNQVYNRMCATVEKKYIGILNDIPSQYENFERISFLGDLKSKENTDYRNWVSRSLGFSDKQLVKLLYQFELAHKDSLLNEEGHESLWVDSTAEMAMLTALYRCKSISELLELSIENLFTLLETIERDPLLRTGLNPGVLIDFSVSDKNVYLILREGESEELMWLTQLLVGIVGWFSKYNLSPNDTLKIVNSLFPRPIGKIGTVPENGLKDEELAHEDLVLEKNVRREKITAFDKLYQKLKPLLLGPKSYVSNYFDERSSSVIFRAIQSSEYGLVSNDDHRLARYSDETIGQAAKAAIKNIGTIECDDLLGLGVEQKVCDKIFNNLIYKGFIDSEGYLKEDSLIDADAFSIETNFDHYHESVYSLVAALHREYVDSSVFSSDLLSLELEDDALKELYDNLVFNGFISDEGSLIESLTFTSTEYIDLFEINSGIGEYSNEVFSIIKAKSEQFNLEKIVISENKFSEIPLLEMERKELIENLRFNDYLNEDNTVIDNANLLSVSVDDLLLAIKFYPQRHAILNVLQEQIARVKDQYLRIDKEVFVAVAGKIIADWVYEALGDRYLLNGRIRVEKKPLFELLENIDAFDLGWPFSKADNTAVFKRIQLIILEAEKYEFSAKNLGSLNFDAEEAASLIDQLKRDHFLAEENTLIDDKVSYFLNVNNALEFDVPEFEDYNKDVFFLLHAIAKNTNQAIAEVAALHNNIYQLQQALPYRVLKDVLGVTEENLKTIAGYIYQGVGLSGELILGEENIGERWLTPILAGVDVFDRISKEPSDSTFNTNYRRIYQFAILTKKLNLSADEIDIVFQDQGLVSKFPESISLPAVNYGENDWRTIDAFDVLLESNDGNIYLFKNSDDSIEGDYPRYWVYSSISHKQLETIDDKLTTLLCGSGRHNVGLQSITAAFVDKHKRDVIIADGNYYIRQILDESVSIVKDMNSKFNPKERISQEQDVWLVADRKWGLLSNEFSQLYSVDAAFIDESGRSYLFSNEQYIRYSRDLDYVDDGYPRRISESWGDEAYYKDLPKSFTYALDAAFHGADNISYFFKDGHYIASNDPSDIRETKERWGLHKNNIVTSGGISAAYFNGETYYIFSGDQVFAYRDSLENNELSISEGYPLEIKSHYGEKLPALFRQDIDAVFIDGGDNTRLFRGEEFSTLTPANLKGEGKVPAVQSIKEHWGLIRNQIVSSGRIDAALMGLDGRVYIFSGDQYFRYSSGDYSIADSGYPRSVKKDWGGLESVDAAFVHGGHTYLFGTSSNMDTEVGTGAEDRKVQAAYVRYGKNDYSEPDENYPKLQSESDDYFWNLPESIKQSASFQKVDAVFNAPDNKTYLFSGNQFIYYDQTQRWWSEPSEIKQKWEELTFKSIDAAFYGKDGKIYLFSNNEYVRYSDAEYCHIDSAYPRPVDRFWGNIKNNIQECGRIDAAIHLESREKDEHEDGTVTIVRQKHTYFFSGDQFYRYSDDQYQYTEYGYPKSLSELNKEPRFLHLPDTLVVEFDRNSNNKSWVGASLIDAMCADERNVTIVKGSEFYVVSDQLGQHYPLVEHEGLSCTFIDEGSIFCEKQGRWYQSSNPEGSRVKLVETPPALLIDVPEQYSSGLSSVLKGRDKNTYLFKGSRFFNRELSRDFLNENFWGRVKNNIQDKGYVDTAFVGRDGRTYVFSGDQFVIYEGNDYEDKLVYSDAKNIQGIYTIAEKWAGLESVHSAYVVGEHTYVFEHSDKNGEFRYIRYSGSRYDRVDEGYPKTSNAEDFWKIPKRLLNLGWGNFSDIIIERGKTKGTNEGDFSSLVFLKGCEFVQYDVADRYWSEPKSLDVLWPGLPCETKAIQYLRAAFVASTGKAYFFGEQCYVTYQDARYSLEKPTKYDWAKLPNKFNSQIDAAVVDRHEITYLFSGRHYIRYTGSSYSHVDEGYPKLITKDLRSEQSFHNLPEDFEPSLEAIADNMDTNGLVPGGGSILQGVISNARHVYVYMGGKCYVASQEFEAVYPVLKLTKKVNPFAETGKVDAAFTNVDNQIFLFSGKYYLRYSNSKCEFIDEGYPKRIATGLAKDIVVQDSLFGIPAELFSGVDAALTDSNGYVNLFKGDCYFNTQQAGLHPIQERWGKVKNNFSDVAEGNEHIDAAFVDSRGKLYAFKGDQYIQYATTEETCAEVGFPKAIKSTFSRLPSACRQGISSAFTFEGKTYLTRSNATDNDDQESSKASYIRYLDESYGRNTNDSLMLSKDSRPRYFTDDFGKWGDYALADIHTICRFKYLQDNFSGDSDIVSLFSQNNGAVPHLYQHLAEIFAWDIEDLKWLKRHHAFLGEQEPDERNFKLELLIRMFDTFNLLRDMGGNAAKVYRDIWQKRYSEDGVLSRSEGTQWREAADSVLTLLGTSYCGSEDWNVLIQEVHNKLNEVKRDALVAAAVHLDGSICDERDLYEQLLIDVKMSGEIKTSRIKEGISALQLYFHRYFINLEPAELTSENVSQNQALTTLDKTGADKQRKELKTRWQWMQNYRVWEANRKVFLYPENYIRPELRDTKTPEFKTLEEQLLQGELNEANITRVFNHYIDQYSDVSQLKISGGYVYDDQADKNIVLFGRTKSDPRRYFYRTAKFTEGKTEAANWQPWAEVNVHILSDRVYPVFAFNKIFIFWAVIETKSSNNANTKVKMQQKGDAYTSESDAVTQSVLQVYYSYYNLNGEWVPQQKMDYSITSNDTITSYFLDFSGTREEQNDNLDNIKVRCHYSTEKELKPDLDPEDAVDIVKNIILFAGKDIYLRAANADENYYIDTQSDNLAYAKRVVPGDGANSSARFHFHLLNLKGLLAITSADKPDSNLINVNGRVSLVSKNLTPANGYRIIKGLIGEGYSFIPHNQDDSLLHYNEKRELWARPWDEMNTHAEQRNATFRFVTERKEEVNTFRFYPETNVAVEVTELGNTQLPQLLQSGVETFKSLFPKENSENIDLPILLNVPFSEKSQPWVCFDYKGGSFLCKPKSEINKDIIQVELPLLPSGLGSIISAFSYQGFVYLFSQSHFVKVRQKYLLGDRSEPRPELKLKKISDVWGKVNNTISSEGKVDSAFVKDGMTYLIRGAQVIRYSNGYEYVDPKFPQGLSSVGAEIFTHIDAAFNFGKRYLVSGEDYIVEGSNTRKSIFDTLWPSNKSLKSTRAIVALEGTNYTINDTGEWHEQGSDVELTSKLTDFYQESAADAKELPAIQGAFVVGSKVYLRSNTKFLTFKGGSSSGILKHLIGENNFKAVFVDDNSFYTLSAGEDSVQIWDKRTNKELGKVTLKNIPEGENFNGMFHTEGKTYLLVGNEYMCIDGLPTLTDGKKGNIEWKSGDTLSKYILSKEIQQPLPTIAKIDSAFVVGGKLFITSGESYIRFSNESLASIDSGYPKNIKSSNEDNLPAWDRIDAAFEGIDETVRFFRDDEYVTRGKSEDNKITLSQVYKISGIWGNVQNNIQQYGTVDEVYNTKESLFLISGGQYFRYKLSDLDQMEPGYPKPLHGNTENIPSVYGMLASFYYGDSSYFLYNWGVYVKFTPSSKSYKRRLIATDWNWTGNYDVQAAFTVGDELNELIIIKRNQVLHYTNPEQQLLLTENNRYDIVRLSSLAGSKLSQALFANGLNGLMNISNQVIDELPTFTCEENRSGDAVIQASPEYVSGEFLPVNSHLDFKGANGVYYWEIFYHGPMLIAQALNTAQRFKDASRWFQYVFDPSEKTEYWKFLPFIAVDISALLVALTPLESRGNYVDKVKALTDRLAPFAPVLSGNRSMLPDEKMEFSLLQQWTDKAFTTWDEVSALEVVLDEDIAASKKQVMSSEIRNLIIAKEVVELIKKLPQRYTLMVNEGPDQIQRYLDDPFDPHAIAALRRGAYKRTTVMAYIDNIIDWGDQLFRQYTRESINEARMLYVLAYDLLGKKPQSMGSRVLPETLSYENLASKGAESDPNVYDFLFDVADGNNSDNSVIKSFSHSGRVHSSVANPYYFVPENEQVLKYWERIEDRLFKIRNSMNIMGIKQVLPLFQPPIDPMALVRAIAGGASVQSAVLGMQVTIPHYRFSYMLQKTREVVEKVNQFSGELLAALEKQDAEEYSLLQIQQEAVILNMTKEIKESQLKESLENLKYLEESKSGANDQKQHYENLIDEGMIPAEIAQIALMTSAAVVTALVPILKIAGAALQAVPDVKIGAPTSMGATTGGSTLGAALTVIADSGESIAEALSIGGEVAGIFAQHQRSEQDWELQRDMAASEIRQLEYQIEGAKWQIRGAEQEIATQEKEIEHNESVNIFMKNKFTNKQLYQWLSGRLSSLFFQTYHMAHDMGKAAEKSFVFERGVAESKIDFIKGGYWDSQKKGLLSGYNLGADLDRMEKAFMESDSRRFEITKTVSLADLDPVAFLQLRNKRQCEFKFTEELFDYDFPGHYCRQVKSIAVSIIAGEGKTVNATLTQLNNKTLMEADLKAVKYLLKPKDEQPLSIRNDWRPTQQIAVSEVDQYTGNSNGTFELRFDDPRYVPFEGTGAISSWRLELSGKKGSYNINELEDVQVEIKYTALQGGSAFADAVKGLLKPYDTAVYMDIAQTFPSEFFAYVNDEIDEMRVHISKHMFPNMSGSKITGVLPQFEVDGEGSVSIVMNDDTSLTLRDNKLLLINSLTVGPQGADWSFTVKGNKANLVNVGLVFTYRADVE
ncbi:MAG: hypothetical protein ACI9UT_001022 [Flavobacteriales bacterium]|jgi:hypothetical protein